MLPIFSAMRTCADVETELFLDDVPSPSEPDEPPRYFVPSWLLEEIVMAE